MNPSERPSGSGLVDPERSDILEIITTSGADGITIQDASGALVYANDAAARTSGFASGKEMRGATAEEIMARFVLLGEDGNTLSPSELPGRRALQGEEEPEAVVRFRKRSGGEDRWALVHATPLFDDEGKVRRVVNVFVDITADRMRRRAQAFLAEAARELARSLDWGTTLQRVARLAVPEMADWCSVDIVEPDGSLSLIAVAHVDPEKIEWAIEMRRRFPPNATDVSGVAHVIRTGASELVPEITQELIDAANISDPELLEVVDRLRLSSVMYIPLIARGRTLGALTMVWAESGRHYSEDDVAVAEDLASRAALAIDNARLYRDRVQAARTLQDRLLPRRLPAIPGIQVAARYLAADDILQAGGDFYDLFEMDDGTWKAVIGDVCGKGPEAAALMGFVRFTTRAVSRQDTQPSEALMKLNKALLEELDADDGEFCTAAVVRIRLLEEGVRLTVAVAGHPLPLVLRANGDIEEAGAAGSLLGIHEEIDVSDQIVDLRPGDSFVMLTDGVWEAGRDDEWASGVVPELIASSASVSADDLADRILDRVSLVPDRRKDDIAVLVLRCGP